MGKARSMGRKITRDKTRGKKVYIDKSLYGMMAAMARTGRTSIDIVVGQLLMKGLEKLNDERQDQDKGRLIKVVGGLPGEQREEAERAVRSVRDRLLDNRDPSPHTGGESGV